jgi:hypothetical protein
MRWIKFAVAAVLAIGIFEATYNVHVFIAISIFLYCTTALLWMKDTPLRSRQGSDMSIPVNELRRLKGSEQVRRRRSIFSVVLECATSWAYVLRLALWVLTFRFAMLLCSFAYLIQVLNMNEQPILTGASSQPYVSIVSMLVEYGIPPLNTILKAYSFSLPPAATLNLETWWGLSFRGLIYVLMAFLVFGIVRYWWELIRTNLKVSSQIFADLGIPPESVPRAIGIRGS